MDVDDWSSAPIVALVRPVPDFHRDEGEPWLVGAKGPIGTFCSFCTEYSVLVLRIHRNHARTYIRMYVCRMGGRGFDGFSMGRGKRKKWGVSKLGK